jgi:hypothetical protein
VSLMGLISEPLFSGQLQRRVSLFAAALVMASCASQAPEPATVPVPPGTPVPLILARQISAGDIAEGAFVPFLVSEDVVIDGKVVIPRGSPAGGTVTWSRSEGTLSGLMNKPARLEVRIDFVRLESGPMQVATDPTEPKKPYAFTRENTGIPAADTAKVEELLKDEVNRKLAEKLGELFEGKTPDLSTPESQATLQKIAADMGLNDTTKLLNDGKSNAGQIAGTIERLQRGDLSGLAKGELSLSLGAVIELANLVGGFGDRISRSLKGRTIRAYPGTKVTAYLVSGTTVTVR